MSLVNTLGQNRILILGVNFRYWQLIILISIAWVLYFLFLEAYQPSDQHQSYRNDGRLFVRSSFFLFALGFCFFVFHVSFSRTVFGLYSLVAVGFIFIFRAILRATIFKKWRLERKLVQDIYLIGNTKTLEEYRIRIEQNLDMGYHVMDICILQNSLAGLDDFVKKALQLTSNPEILILTPDDGDLTVGHLVNYLSQFPVTININPALVEQDSYVNFLLRDSDSPFFYLKSSRISALNLALKRIFDIVFSLIVIIFDSHFG
ncbi:MAG: hypothetical protein WDN07_01240 [Actinomycetota bacterium]